MNCAQAHMQVHDHLPLRAGTWSGFTLHGTYARFIIAKVSYVQPLVLSAGHFLVVTHNLWLLQSFCPFFLNDHCGLGVGHVSRRLF